jgi:hypothetical protein
MNALFTRVPQRAPRACCPALSDRYFHVYLRVIEAWGTPALPGILKSVILASRVKRRGFPTLVMRELLALAREAMQDRPGEFEWFDLLKQRVAQDRGHIGALNASDPHAVATDLFTQSSHSMPRLGEGAAQGLGRDGLLRRLPRL